MSRISITESRVPIKDNPFRACCIALALGDEFAFSESVDR
jgi:hypothetical protein